ncbi:hypothetical protein CTAYLR_003292 [Chrysophaeum taylorii]|uniref:C2 domain-containing protein n=1 Tax=Chrysophaeum taylorii TaxID=2483200 RepID=A0AAD7UAJ3_9STRA|nr:hypothetical protein CTAYLR_003292 [Chrysophaeum taylorii]
MKKSSVRRQRSAVLVVPASPTSTVGDEEVGQRGLLKTTTRLRLLVVLVGVVAAGVVVIPILIRWARVGLWIASLAGCHLIFRFVAPEVLGIALSFVVTKIALFDEVDMVFTGVRIVPWIELHHARESEDDEPFLARPRARFIDADGNEVEASFRSLNSFFGSGLWPVPATLRERVQHLARGLRHQPSQHPRHYPRQSSPTRDSSSSSFSSEATPDPSVRDSGCLFHVMSRAVPRWRQMAELSRLCVEVRVKKFVMGNPRNSSDWCRDRFCVATDVEVVLSMTLGDVAQLPCLTRYWSWRPRDQPIRPADDGGGLSFGAVRDPQTHTMRNRVMLGVIDVDKFSLCDAEVAFEQCEGRLNCVALGTALARGEIKAAAWKGHRAARACYSGKLNRLRVDVLAARDLDKTRQQRGSTTNGAAANTFVPSTFAHVRARMQQRRSRTVIRNADPVFGYEPEPMVATDPSTVVHIVIFEEARFGDTVVGQWATTLKQLVLEPHLADGGKGLDAADVLGNERENDEYGSGPYVERKGWVPLRDVKWRPFDVPRFRAPNRDCTTIMNRLELDGVDAEVFDSSLADAPPLGYPAALIRIRWERSEDIADVDESKTLTALEHMKLNTAETACRIGCVDNVRAMLSTFPFFFDCRGGFKITGRAVAHIRDLFLGNEGSLERMRRKRPDLKLTNADWRLARRQAIVLSRIEVAFPSSPDEHRHRYGYVATPQDGSLEVPVVEERRGFLTLETATTRLVRGLIERVLASGRVGASLGHIVSAVSYGAVMGLTTNGGTRSSSTVDADDDKKISTFELAKRTSRASRVPFGALRGYRSDRQFALLLGLYRHSYKRMDARSYEDLSKPVRAAGILMKSSKQRHGHRNRKWKPYRCVLRGATLFYFEIAGAKGPKSNVRRGEDRAIDLHRVVADLTADEPIPNADGEIVAVPAEPVMVRLEHNPSEDRDEIELGIRLDNGGVHSTFLAVPPEVASLASVGALHRQTRAVLTQEENDDDDGGGGPLVVPEAEAAVDFEQIEAVGWDKDAYAAVSLCLTRSIRDWRDAIVAAVWDERLKAREEIGRIIIEYHRSQQRFLAHDATPAPINNGDEKTPHGDDDDDDDDGKCLRREAKKAKNEEGKVEDVKAPAHPAARDVEAPPLESVVVASTACCAPAPVLAQRDDFPVNGAWHLVKRGHQLDTLLEVEGVSFGARMLLSAATATVWIHVDSNRRAHIHMQDGFMAHRFMGPLDHALETRKISTNKKSPIVIDKVTMSPDGRRLRLEQISPVTHTIFYTTEWTCTARDVLERRTRWSHADIERHGTLFTRGGDFDCYERARGDHAVRIELAAAL